MNLVKFKQVQNDIFAALENVSKKHNLTFSYKGGTNNPANNAEDVFRIAAIENAASGQPRDLEREAFLAYIKEWDKPGMVGYLKKEWLDKTFRDRGHVYTIVGYAPRKKNCVVTKRDDGKTYCWVVRAIERCMKAA